MRRSGLPNNAYRAERNTEEIRGAKKPVLIDLQVDQQPSHSKSLAPYDRALNQVEDDHKGEVDYCELEKI